MGRSKETFSKREKEKKRIKKREEKARRKAERKEQDPSTYSEMIAYVNHNGEIVDTPPDPDAKEKIKAEDIIIGVPPKDDSDWDPVRQGRVQFFNDEKGYGFIKDLETNEEHYVHARGLVDEIRDHDMVTFELERGQKGMNAVNVKLQE